MQSRYIVIFFLYISGGLELFKGLLKSEFSEQNVELWITCEEFRCSGDANMHVFAQKIYGDFVVYNAPKEV
jgi:regulator of G-protein signaling